MKTTTDVHKHRCGLSAVGELSALGCGHEWEHERIFITPADYTRRHMCPACGAGPWYVRLDAYSVSRAPVITLSVIEFDADELRELR